MAQIKTIASKLQIQLLGGHIFRLDGVLLALPQKGKALLTYLALCGGVHSRKSIAELLWTHSDKANGLRSLRVLLSNLGNKFGLTNLIRSSKTEIWLNEAYPVQCDVLHFQHLMLHQTMSHQAMSHQAMSHQTMGERRQLSHDSMDDLRKGIDLYLGQFMLGFDVLDVAFDEWMYQRRMSLEATQMQALSALLDLYDVQDNPTAAIEYAHRMLDIDPWLEQTRRRLMLLLARSDRRGAALHQYDLCCQILWRELEAEPEEETVTLAERIRAGEIAVVQSEPLPSFPNASDVPFLAPAKIDTFVGRREIMTRMQASLAANSGKNELPSRRSGGRFHYCLTGMAGVGKTALAIQLAHLLQPFFEDGVLWADGAHESPAEIAERWAAAFGYDFNSIPKEADRFASLRELLGSRNVLLIVDDVVNASRIRPLIPVTGRGGVLFSSRHVDIAHLLNAQPVLLDTLSVGNGRSLFINLISMERANREPLAVEQICQLLHNLPLAIIIIGNHLIERPHRRLADFVQQLESETTRLDLSSANRQVRASFNISWNSLQKEEKRWFKLLGLFGGHSFSPDAFAAVAHLGALMADGQLANLCKSSLLTHDGVANLEVANLKVGRYRQHPLLAEFAKEKLGRDVDATTRMIGFFLGFAKEHRTDYELLRPEWGLMEVSINAAHRLRLWQQVVDFVEMLQVAWFARGRYAEVRRACRVAHEAAMVLEDETAVAQNKLRWGEACMEQGDYDQSRQHLHESVALFREVQHESGVADGLAHLGRIDIEQTNYEAALRQLDESYQLRKKLNDQAGLAEIMYRKARIALRQYKSEEAEQLAQNALGLQETVNDIRGVSKTLRLLTFINIGQSLYEQAQEYASQSLSLAQKLQDKSEIVMAYYALSNSQRRLGNYEDALATASKCLDLMDEIGDKHLKARVLYQHCLIYKQLEDYAAAERYVQQCLPLFREVNDRLNVAFTLLNMGDILEARGNLVDVRKLRLEASNIAHDIGNKQIVDYLKPMLERVRDEG